MTNTAVPARRFAVIGGGIAGLAAANRLHELDSTAEIVLFEASDRLGGAIHTIRRDGFLVEAGADSFISDPPPAIDLCRRIGSEDQLVSTEPSNRRALVLSRGRLHPVPEGFSLLAPERVWPLLRSGILSWRGKLRAACERFVAARRDGADESLASFARRRLGREAFERLVQPLVAGIYTADAEKLSLAATMPRFLELERQHGSLIRGMRSQRHTSEPGGPRYSLFVAPRDGMSTLVDALVHRLPSGAIRLTTPVDRIDRIDSRWRVRESTFDGVILATPAPTAARLLDGIDGALAAQLRDIEYAGSAVVALAYTRGQIAHPLGAFGFVVPAIERRRILSASFSSLKFVGRAPQGQVLIRVFLGGGLQPEMLERSDAELQQIAHDELRDVLGISGEPSLSIVFRWPQAMPQYHLGHLERVERITARLAQLPGLALAGNAYRGVGIPQCIRSGEEAAERVLAMITAPTAPARTAHSE